jgi:S-adenosylmethionine:tRNA ribosyltransferase-isomerase
MNLGIVAAGTLSAWLRPAVQDLLDGHNASAGPVVHFFGGFSKSGFEAVNWLFTGITGATMLAGLGNFREIDVEDLTKHKMDSEQMYVNADACRIVNNAKDEGKNICAVGTTVMRTIETAVGTDGHLKEFDGWTNKFIFPPYDFSVANSMVTNFHLPLSTLLMLVAAYGGYDLVMEAYHTALKEDYRFGTYGDAMLILDK